MNDFFRFFEPKLAGNASRWIPAGIVPSSNQDEHQRLTRHITQLQSLIKSRRFRGVAFDPRLFADPAWDMLVNLSYASLTQRRMTVRSLSSATNVPPTTALRWIETLQKAQLVVKDQDPLDQRRKFIAITELGLNSMRRYLDKLKELFNV